MVRIPKHHEYSHLNGDISGSPAGKLGGPKLRTQSETGSGLVSALVGLLLATLCLSSLAQLARMAILEQKLEALATDSVRILAAARSQADPLALRAAEAKIVTNLSSYGYQTGFSANNEEGTETFTISVTNYRLSIWPGLVLGPYTLSAAGASRVET